MTRAETWAPTIREWFADVEQQHTDTPYHAPLERFHFYVVKNYLGTFKKL